MKKQIILVTGPIGVGKTTLCKALQQKGYMTAKEFEVDGFLFQRVIKELHAKEKKLDLSIVQQYTALDRLLMFDVMIKDYLHEDVIIFDRSPFDIDIFNKVVYREIDFKWLPELIESIKRLLNYLIDRGYEIKVVSLTASPEKLKQRVSIRNRQGDEFSPEMTLVFENWSSQVRESVKGFPVTLHEIDCENDNLEVKVDLVEKVIKGE